MKEIQEYTILIVDDVAKNIQVVANILNPNGYKLLFCQSAKKSLEIVKNKDIDLILLDIMMPEMNGYDVCREIKMMPDKKDIPVIFLTAKNDIDSITKGFDVGGVDYIIKPFNNQELLVRVENHLKMRHAFNMVSKQNEELTRLNETKDKFFSIIAHDLRNPFNAIYMMSEVLKRRVKSICDDEAEQIVDLLYISTKEVYELLDNLLTWSRMQRNKLEFYPEELKLSKLISSTISLYENIARSKKINLEVKIPGNIIIKADRNMLNTIMRNLITNSIKFTHDKGNIKVEAKDGNEFIEISVEDTGIGMRPEEIEKIIFNEDVLSKPGTADERGSGIGLILCKEFIHKHQGKLWVKSEVGKGSTFYFTIKK